MNARLYDPIIGRHVSPDPTVPDPMDQQAFNRFSYVLNNALVYTDPTGLGPEAIFTTLSNPFWAFTSQKNEAAVRQDRRCPALWTCIWPSDSNSDNDIPELQQALNTPRKKVKSLNQLLQEAQDAWRGNGCKSPTLDCAERNTKLSEFYSKYLERHQALENFDMEILAAIFPLQRLASLGRAAALEPVGLSAAKSGVQILEREGNVVIASFKVAKGEARVAAEMVRDGDKLILKGAHIEGSGTLKEALSAAKSFGREQGVKEVVIEGGVRTTGANPGHLPRPITISTGL